MTYFMKNLFALFTFIALLVAYIGIPVTVLIVAWHFISKYW